MTPLRLRRVAGYGGRLNDTLFQPAAVCISPQQTLVYFGGDVQDYPEVMQSHRDNKHYLKWNLESTAQMLGHNFPTKHILVVRPSRIEYKSFSCYDNFVPCNNAGVPEHTPTHNALQHLERLLERVDERLKSLPTSELEATSPVPPPEHINIEDLHKTSIRLGTEQSESNGGQASGSARAERNQWLESEQWRERVSVAESRLTLVGFSKGCVVLNQLLYEFHYTSTLTPSDARATRFIDRIEDMYWLDGGHAGGKNTWITSRCLLETFSRLDVRIYIHVSPYQVLDESRPWIGREEKAFSGLLRKLGAKVQRHMHGAPRAPHSLHMHFGVLAGFHRVEESTAAALTDSDDDDSRRSDVTAITNAISK